MVDRGALVARLRAAGCVFAEQEADLLLEAAPDRGALDRLVDLRVGGLPLEQVLGWVRFAGQRLAVAPGVFVPRRRTELLVAGALDALDGPDAVLVDLCCGVGAVAAAVLAARPGTVVHAVDTDATAIACARRNLPEGAVHHGDLDTPLPHDLRGRVDVITACAPYVPTDAVALMPPEARDHEPRGALDGGVDGLDVVRRIVALAPRWLRPVGTVVLEVGDDQVDAVGSALAHAGLAASTVTDEDSGTIVIGHRRAVAAPDP